MRRRRSLWAMGVTYLVLTMAVDAADRAGITAGIPVFGSTTQGPLTAGWFLGSLIKHLIMTAFFVWIMSMYLPASAAQGERSV